MLTTEENFRIPAFTAISKLTYSPVIEDHFPKLRRPQ
jgi:hypothetical protein